MYLYALFSYHDFVGVFSTEERLEEFADKPKNKNEYGGHWRVYNIKVDDPNVFEEEGW